MPTISVTYPLPPAPGLFSGLLGNPPDRRDAPHPEWRFLAAALRPWLGYLALIERDGDSGFRFRLAGTNLHARFQAELTGRNFKDVEPDVVGDLEDRVQRAMSLQTPVITGIISAGGNRKFVDLILPLANEGGKIDLVILASCLTDQPAVATLN
jgi:hypothetical protein